MTRPLGVLFVAPGFAPRPIYHVSCTIYSTPTPTAGNTWELRKYLYMCSASRRYECTWYTIPAARIRPVHGLKVTAEQYTDNTSTAVARGRDSRLISHYNHDGSWCCRTLYQRLVHFMEQFVVCPAVSVRRTRLAVRITSAASETVRQHSRVTLHPASAFI